MWGTCKIDLIHDAQHLCTCLRTDGIKVMANGFLGGKQLIKYNQYKKSRSSLFILTTENEQLFTMMANYGWKWSFLVFLDAEATVDFLTASNNEVNFVATQTVHCA